MLPFVRPRALVGMNPNSHAPFAREFEASDGLHEQRAMVVAMISVWMMKSLCPG